MKVLSKIGKTALLLLALSACAASGERTDWHERDSYSGWVTDAATGEPIEGAVVVIKWEIEQHHPLHSRTDRIIRLEETLTDREGRFQFAPLGDYTPALGWERSEFNFPDIAFFKPGYDPTYRQRFTWEFGERPEVANKNPPHPPRKIGWQREIQLYRYTTGPFSAPRPHDAIDRTRTNEQRILNLLASLASSLARNVDISGSDVTPFGGAQRRKAVETQWRAIVMVDAEIRKYRPQYMWSTREIRDALGEKRDSLEGK